MNEKVTKFYETISSDGALQAELDEVVGGVSLVDVPEGEARQAVADAVAAFAAERGLDLAAADLLATDAEAQVEGELADAELAGVAGGACGCFIIGAVKGCGCFVAGAVCGEIDKESRQKFTICPIVGASGSMKVTTREEGAEGTDVKPYS